MSRYLRFRSIIAMLLAFCLISASLWSYGAEATADVLLDECIHFKVDSPDAGVADKHCNHGCHAQSHLTGAGQGNAMLFPMTLAAQEGVGLPDNARILTRPNEGPFRPPRPLFQA